MVSPITYEAMETLFINCQLSSCLFPLANREKLLRRKISWCLVRRVGVPGEWEWGESS